MWCHQCRNPHRYCCTETYHTWRTILWGCLCLFQSVTSALAAIDRLISLGGTPPLPPVVVQPKVKKQIPREGYLCIANHYLSLSLSLAALPHCAKVWRYMYVNNGKQIILLTLLYPRFTAKSWHAQIVDKFWTCDFGKIITQINSSACFM